MHLDEAFHGREQAVAQATVVRAAVVGRNQVDIAFAHRLALLRESHAPGCALALGKVVALRIRIGLAFKERNDGLRIQRLHQVVAQTTFEDPALRFLVLLIDQRDRNTGHQNGLAAQQMGQRSQRQSQGFKVLAIRPDTHCGARLAVALGLRPTLQGLDHITAGKHQACHCGFAVGGDLQA